MSDNRNYFKRIKKYKRDIDNMEIFNKDTKINNGSLITKGIRITDNMKKKMNNEANIQSELYRQLTNDNIDVSVEVNIGRSRCDLVIAKDGYIKCAVEVKKKKRKHFNKDTRQYLKYKKLGIPVIYCLGEENIDKTIKKIKNDMLQDNVIVDLTMFN